MRVWASTSLIAAVAIILFAYTQLTIFVVQPIGMLPEGKTLVIWKRQKTQFIDSADGFCAREVGNVNLLCRGAALAGVIRSQDDILLRLPYSKTLYLISTGGTEYER